MCILSIQSLFDQKHQVGTVQWLLKFLLVNSKITFFWLLFHNLAPVQNKIYKLELLFLNGTNRSAGPIEAVKLALYM